MKLNFIAVVGILLLPGWRRLLIGGKTEHYNEIQLHAVLGYITPADFLFLFWKIIPDEQAHEPEDARFRRRTGSRDQSLA